MKIGIDLDNVLNNLVEATLTANYLVHNEVLTVEDIKCWNIGKYTKRGKKIYEFFTSELLNKSLVPISYSQEVTKRLAERHELFIITATNPKNMSHKVDWLKKHFPHINQNNIIVTRQKDLINVDFLIDDAPHNIFDFPNQSIVLDYPWNRNVEENGIVQRAYDWLDIEKIILEHEGGFKVG